MGFGTLYQYLKFEGGNDDDVLFLNILLTYTYPKCVQEQEVRKIKLCVGMCTTLLHSLIKFELGIILTLQVGKKNLSKSYHQPQIKFDAAVQVHNFLSLVFARYFLPRNQNTNKHNSILRVWGVFYGKTLGFLCRVENTYISSSWLFSLTFFPLFGRSCLYIRYYQ